MRLSRALAVCTCLAATALSVHARPASTPLPRLQPQQAVTPVEVRGLWVLRSTLTSAESIAQMVRLAQSGGFNTLLVQVRGRGEAYYNSRVEPRATELESAPADFDPLATVLALGHQAGLRVHAWVSVNLVASAVSLPRSRDHIVSRHPEWLMVPSALAPQLQKLDERSPGYVGNLARWTRGETDKVEGLYLSPVTGGAREYTASVVGDLLANYALDGIHFDYTRYPNDTFDYSASTLGEFRAEQMRAVSSSERLRVERAAGADLSVWATTYPEAWAAFRRDRLTQLLSQLRGVARATRPRAVVSAAVSPNAEEARRRGFQDWGLWINSGLLDVVCPMAHTTDVKEFSTLVTQARGLVGESLVWAGIGAFTLPVASAADHVRAARQAGANGVILFSYDSINVQSVSYFAELRRLFLGPASDDGSRH